MKSIIEGQTIVNIFLCTLYFSNMHNYYEYYELLIAHYCLIGHVLFDDVLNIQIPLDKRTQKQQQLR